MAQRTDLYTILLSYANKRRSPYIDIDGFIPFIEKYARHYAGERPEWKKWTAEVNSKFWSELSPLVEAGKCELINDGTNGRVLILDFYFEAVNKAYENLDNIIEVPFPDEQTLGISVPAEQIRELDITADMEAYMKQPQESPLPLLKIVFPESLGSALILASYIPKRILEASIQKTSAFLKLQNNKEYFFARLVSQFTGKEPLLRDILSQIELKPKECLAHIETAGEFACLFWPYFCTLIRLELKKKTELIAPDISVLQAAFIIEFFVSYYRSITMKERDREMAMKEIELKIERPPYAYTLKDILKFSDATGRPLTDLYNQKDLDNFLNKRAFFDGNTESGNPLPALLIFHNRLDEQVFISKSKIFPMLTKLLGEARPQVRKIINNRWSKLVKDFKSEPSMENDRDFEKLVSQYLSQLMPNLMMLLDDKKLFLVQEELSSAQGGILDSTRLYQANGALTSFATLLMINRKDLLTDVKIMLPFWYTIPIISSIIAFFKRMGNSKGKKGKSPPQEDEVPGRETPVFHSISLAQDIRRAAVDYQVQTVPPGKTVDLYLKEQQDRWRKVLDPAAKNQLVQDVHSQIKRKLKPILDARGNRKVSSETINEMADSIIMVSPALTELNNSDAIHTYVALCISKLLSK
jgi:hypothetical protein